MLIHVVIKSFFLQVKLRCACTTNSFILEGADERIYIYIYIYTYGQSSHRPIAYLLVFSRYAEDIPFSRAEINFP